MQSISVFLDVVTFADFQSKNADVSRPQGVCCVIQIVFESTLGNKCAKVHHCMIFVTDFMEEGPFAAPPSMSIPEKANLDRVKV